MYDSKHRFTPYKIDTSKVVEDGVDFADSQFYRDNSGTFDFYHNGNQTSNIGTRLLQYQAKLTITHLTPAKHILCCLKCIKDHDLFFRKSVKPLTLIVLCNADWSNSKDSQSITGYDFQLSFFNIR